MPTVIDRTVFGHYTRSIFTTIEDRANLVYKNLDSIELIIDRQAVLLFARMAERLLDSYDKWLIVNDNIQKCVVSAYVTK
ncbi:hypothetical protein [Chamaesiphon sp. GL140_3_metabinner_50]|uniref:hypothetical protein n=1 Tax=Chamaesiphon sp. GL140_3_metabinner_50 TaxID=2970812 RepID=UPI0025F63879|nr:hypothetical protein [Chamaesiphon sp. GL140_3_metabinner_50]